MFDLHGQMAGKGASASEAYHQRIYGGRDGVVVPGIDAPAHNMRPNMILEVVAVERAVPVAVDRLERNRGAGPIFKLVCRFDRAQSDIRT